MDKRLLNVKKKLKFDTKLYFSYSHMQETLQFKISAALKDIIGKDLITDDYIAVFELVKNSFDAHADQVDIYFENIYSSNGRIVIKDNGKGMNYTDLINKWLFVAYSAKREGTEDENFDYRDKIFKSRPFAGAKGIGRFSCDRLGKRLYLETVKKEPDPKTEVLITEWEKFEGDIKQEFINISVLHETLPKGHYELEYGTVLEIIELRSEWDRPKLLKLKDSLAKLINPNKNKDDDFKIVIHVQEEEEEDAKYEEFYEKVNGDVSNFIFDALGIKTTKIFAAISEDGKYITTELTDGGTLIYKIKENNKYNLLDSINYTIYYLNTSAKNTFTRRMGLQSHKFGHIFLYKNGFRVYPYGEPGEDPLKIDSRKSIGTMRYLGTRDIIGQIEIFSSSNELKETSSRGDGLIKTNSYLQLEECFWEVMKRLEKYVVEIQLWGIGIEEDETGAIKDRITELISKLSGSSDIVEIDYSDEIMDKINVAQSQSATVLVENLKKIAIANQNVSLIAEADRISNKIQQLEHTNREVQQEIELVSLKTKEIEQRLEIKEREVELLKEASNEDIVELLSIEHHINQATFRVDGYVKSLYELVKGNANLESGMVDIIDQISLENRKIASLVKFIRSANFDLLSSKITQDLAKYIEQYIKNVYKNDRVRRINKKLVSNVFVELEDGLDAIFNFVPLEINIILDNLLDNSFKASSDTVRIKLSEVNNMLVMDYRDNGIGVNPKIKDIIFDFGVTTTSGSGIGLYQIRRIVESMDGSIISKDAEHGAHFIIELPKKT